MQQQQWGEKMACECIGTCACVSVCCIHLPFICLTVEVAWIVLGCRVREMIFFFFNHWSLLFVFVDFSISL